MRPWSITDLEPGVRGGGSRFHVSTIHVVGPVVAKEDRMLYLTFSNCDIGGISGPGDDLQVRLSWRTVTTPSR